MALVLITVLVERRNIRDISESVTSIYNDRLVPAADIFDLTEEFYNKRFVLEKYLEMPGSPDALRAELTALDREIQSLLTKYEKTYLVGDETRGLEKVKSRVRDYQAHEKRVIHLAENGSRDSASAYYRDHARPVLQATLVELALLSDVQLQVGAELLKKSSGIAAMSRLLLTVQVVLSVVIGMMIVALVNSSRIGASDATNYHLN